jgi:hypothetical protein
MNADGRSVGSKAWLSRRGLGRFYLGGRTNKVVQCGVGVAIKLRFRWGSRGDRRSEALPCVYWV